LKWPSSEAKGILPEYYKLQDQQMRPIEVKDVPPETKLVGQRFVEYDVKNPYQPSPVDSQLELDQQIAAGPFEVELVDGSIVTYSWYRFIDQPALKHLNWDQKERNRLQSVVEKIHSEWKVRREFMSAIKEGKLVELDPALVLTPPVGLEIGFVPVANQQSNR